MDKSECWLSHFASFTLAARTMYKIQMRKNVQRTIDYFLRDPELSDTERCGVWLGRGAQRLGLVANTSEETNKNRNTPMETGSLIVVEHDLRAALEGYGPPGAGWQAGRPLNGRYMTGGVRRCAWDCVLSAHKSVSVASLCLPPEFADHSARVRTAFDLATVEAFSFMESVARRANGRHPDVETHSLLAARFCHEASRRQDPQLHAHLLVANATHDPHGNAPREWYALQTLQLYRQAREIDLVFQRALNRHLQLNGIDSRILAVDGLPVTVLPGVDPPICRRLSRAHLAIQERVAGLWTRAERDIHHKRQENLYNEQLRPPKAGSLQGRTDRFERALSGAEVASIVSRLRMAAPIRSEGQPSMAAPLLTPHEMRRLVFQAALQLGYTSPTPAQLSRAALVASSQTPVAPYLPFWNQARMHLARMLEQPTDDRSVFAHVDAHLQYWQAEEEYYYARSQDKSVTPQGWPAIRAETQSSHLDPSEGQSNGRGLLAHGKPRSDEPLEMFLETTPNFAPEDPPMPLGLSP